MRLPTRTKRVETAAQAEAEYQACQAEIQQASDVARAALQRRHDLLAEGTLDQIRQAEVEADAAELAKERAQARLPGLAARLNELRTRESKVLMAADLAHLEETLMPYLAAARAYAGAAQAALAARNDFAKHFPIEANGLPPIPPITFDMAAIHGTTPTLSLAPAVYEFTDGAARAIMALRRKLT